MANKPLTTTVIGSFTKPSYLPIEDQFNRARNDGGINTESVTKEFTQYIEKKSVIFGAIAIASSRLESEEEIIDRINAALLHIDRERLVIAPDCGLCLLTPDLAESKRRVMCSAVKRVD